MVSRSLSHDVSPKCWPPSKVALPHVNAYTRPPTPTTASAPLQSSYQRPVSGPMAVDAHVDGSPPSQPEGTFAVVLAWNGTSHSARVWPLSDCEAIEMVVSVPVIAISSVAGGELSTPFQCAVAGFTDHAAERDIA